METVIFGEIPNLYTGTERKVCTRIYEVISGLQYGDVSSEVRKVDELAKENDIVIIYPASDDLVEFAGVVSDEVNCCDSCSIRFDEHGDILVNECEDECCPYFQEKLEKYDVKVTAEFDSTEEFFITCENGVYFSMMEDNKLIARGVIVPRRFLRG